MKNEATSVLLALSLLAIPCGSALAVEYTVRAGGSYNDNIQRAPDNEEDSSVGIVGLTLANPYESRRLTANIDIDLDHRFYSVEGVDDETVGFATADALLTLIPGFIDWFAEYEFGTVQTDPFGVNRPGNRGNINAWSTGPNFHMELGTVTALELQGRYMETGYEAIDLDNSTLQGNLAVQRSISTNRTVSLNLTADRTEYESAVQETKFDRQSAAIGFDSVAARGTLGLRIGYNEVHDAGRVLDGTMLNVSFTRELTPRSTFSLDYDQRISDAGDLFRRFGEQQRGVEDVIDFTDVSNPVENRRIGAELRLNGRVTNYHINVAVDDMDFDTAESRDRRREQLQMGVSRSFGPAWDVDLVAQLSRNEFDVSEREDDDIGVTASLTRRLTEKLGLRVGYEYASRNSDDPQFEYDQNEYSLMFTWSSR